MKYDAVASTGGREVSRTTHDTYDEALRECMRLERTQKVVAVVVAHPEGGRN